MTDPGTVAQAPPSEIRRAALARAIANEIARGSRRIESQSEEFAVLIHRRGRWIERRHAIQVDEQGRVITTDLGWTPTFWKFVTITTVIFVLVVLGELTNHH
jgi:hypothetical protein